MVKEKKTIPIKKSRFGLAPVFIPVIIVMAALFFTGPILYFEKSNQGKIYPGVRIGGMNFGGKTRKTVVDYFNEKNIPFGNIQLVLSFEDKIATLSAQDLAVSFDGQLSAEQAYSIGRSNQILTDFYQKWRALSAGIELPSVLKYDTGSVDDAVERMSEAINISAQDALFQFDKGKVSEFRTSKPGRAVNQFQTKQLINSYINQFAKQADISPAIINIKIPVDIKEPRITTENSNNYGIKDLLGSGSSKFHGSIQSRMHNVNLASSKINGHLIPPGTVFSFNETLGDVSAATGFLPAYIIKEGRTVLGDGGGVCQVSTTLFRAALNAGMPIIERHAHAYRVHYYEEESPVGIDATVFDPTNDLKFKNDTDNYILIQTKADIPNYSLTFELYGTSDGRKAIISKPVLYGQAPPPPDLYQDDPTIPKGVIKQVDWSAWGAKTNFDYSVEKNGQVINKQSFFSNYKPWQAVFLRGTL